MDAKKLVLSTILCIGIIGIVSGTVIDSGFIDLNSNGQLIFGDQNNTVISSNTGIKLTQNNEDKVNITESQSDLFEDLSLNSNNLVNVGLIDGVHVTDHSVRHESNGGDELNVAGLPGVLSEPQPVQVHDNTDHSEDYTSKSTDLESFSTTSTKGSIPVSQNNGQVQMETQSELGLTESVIHADEKILVNYSTTVILDNLQYTRPFDPTEGFNPAATFDVLDSQVSTVDDTVGATFNNDGTIFYGLNGGLDPTYESKVTQYKLGQDYQLETYQSFESKSIQSNTIQPYGMDWSGTGDKLFVVNRTDQDQIHEYTASNPFNITSLTFNTKHHVDITPSGENVESSDFVEDIEFSNNGDTMYIGTYYFVHQYDLSTAYDPATASYQNSLDLSDYQGSGNTQIDLSNDGSLLTVIAGSAGTDNGVYEMSTSNDLSTASLKGKFDDDELLNEFSITYNGDGTNLITGRSGNFNQWDIGRYTTPILSTQKVQQEGSIVRVKDATGTAGGLQERITTEGSATINGEEFIRNPMKIDYGSVTFKSDGQDWHTIGGYGR